MSVLTQPARRQRKARTWMFIRGPRMRRATATVQSSSSRGGSGAAAMAVPCLALKFWMITWRRAAAAGAPSMRVDIVLVERRGQRLRG